jgi:hypothetical protein
MQKHHQNSTLPVKRGKGENAKFSWWKTGRIARHYQNSVFSLSMSTANAKLSKMFIGESARITR